MPKSMVVVESPAKARTIAKYLGAEYQVRACAGHIKDLPKNVLGVDLKHDFEPTYQIIGGKEKILNTLKKVARQSDSIYLAADPDREGEAICQHLAEELASSGDLPVYRVLFNEITPKTILAAFENPVHINLDKVAAQQARRILDRLVGYKVSPLLWKKVRRGLSAGRVQSVALRLVVDREAEISAFQPEEYWNFQIEAEASRPPRFQAKAVLLDGKKFKIPNQEEADRLLKQLRDSEFKVAEVRQKKRPQRPAPPFITSTLQQEASRKLRFPLRKTMRLAQRLYEGIDLGQEGRVGLITYMRTDSTRVSNTAIAEVRRFIAAEFGDKYLPGKAVVYKQKKRAQDAHEAVRPTLSARRPNSLKGILGRDEYRLYQLIWRRFVASQMQPALFDQTEIDIKASLTLFRAVGKILRFKGFLVLDRDSDATADPRLTALPQEKDKRLPPVETGEILTIHSLTHEQKFTQPPPRYSEASLVKTLEEKGIGRPSTYSQIITVIQDREYVAKRERRFVPTETGEVVSQLLVRNFEEIFDYDYTARLEKDLDNIEQGKANWVQTLRQFYSDFSRELERANRAMKNLKREEKPAGFDCDKCGSEMVIKWGRFGRFVACSNYPKCRNTKELSNDKYPQADQSDHEPCEKCGNEMVLKKGRFGEFLACSGYPKCKNTRRLVKVAGRTEAVKDRPLDAECPRCGDHLVAKQGRFGEFVACSNYPKCRYIQQQTTGVTCPQCNRGEIVQKKSQRGRIFFSCDAYPKCKYVLWKKPIPQPCPKCKSPYLLESSTKKDGLCHTCNNKKCDYRRAIQPAATI